MRSLKDIFSTAASDIYEGYKRNNHRHVALACAATMLGLGAIAAASVSLTAGAGSLLLPGVMAFRFYADGRAQRLKDTTPPQP